MTPCRKQNNIFNNFTLKTSPKNIEVFACLVEFLCKSKFVPFCRALVGVSLKLQDRGFSALPPLCQPTSQQSSSIEGGAKSISKKMVNGDTLHLEIGFVVCFGAEEN